MQNNSNSAKLYQDIKEFAKHIIEDVFKQKSTPEMIEKCAKKMIKVFPKH